MWAELVVNYDHFFVLMDLKRLHHCDKPTTGGRQFSARLPQAAGRKTNTLAARGLEECASFPDFCDNRQLHSMKRRQLALKGGGLLIEHANLLNSITTLVTYNIH